MKRLLLIGIIALAFFLRTLNLTDYPVGFTPDEASFGYDAYSILKTGKDQWGHPFPLVLESFGDFKSPLYAYLAIPSVAAFGLTKFAVRLPNAVLGSLSVLVLYLLCKELFKGKNLSFDIGHLALAASLLLAISPWHIMMSRGAFEANLITFFIPLGIYFFLEKKYELSALVFGLSLFTYHSAKLISPIIFFALLVIFRVKKPITVGLFGAFFVLMLYANSLGGNRRIAERSIMAGALEVGATRKIQLISEGMNPILARLLNNKYEVALVRFIRNYEEYFSPRFLFTQGPGETTYGMIPGVGVLYFFDGILLLGLIPAFTKKKLKFVILAIFGWLVISPIPAALSTGVGYAANRAVSMIPAWQILEAIGAYGMAEWLKKYDRRFLAMAAIIISLLAAGQIVNVYKKYIIESPTTAAKGMLVGNLEKAQELVVKSDEYDSLTVPRSWSEPQIYIAFAAKYNPEAYQEATKNWKYQEIGVSWVDQIPEYSLGKFIFK